MESQILIKKYNVPAPRYTSYPPVPFWDNQIDGTSWHELVKDAYRQFGDREGIQLYIHLPYCESLCTYCGCNKRITTNHKVELPYISTVMKEWDNYLRILPEKPLLSGIHLGGGTPTFFSPESLQILIRHIRNSTRITPDAEFSFEGHPNNTTKSHLQALYEVGFRRVSYGIQDFDEKVQKAIHRVQPLENVERATRQAREIGYTSVNFDLIYGLPHQTQSTIKDTFEKVASLRPDRIAFYSYAHLPTVFPAQRSFEAHLPNEEAKRSLYETGKSLLSGMGYLEIGMDHFALPQDPLNVAKVAGNLHRNFMGYTTMPSKILIGLGNSAISDVYLGYSQNEKKIECYKEHIVAGTSPLIKGHRLTNTDLKMKNTILSLICNNEAKWEPGYDPFSQPHWAYALKTFEEEGLIAFDLEGIRILDKGVAFVRNICMALDPYFQQQLEKPVFSKAI
ncbi:oxygen-independent coproporphyrinogen III oxidase [Pleomorphovibrio marinus]|uniref:oxygen-independent coproporphyrinogen III oxidase n=1 Tax=Pleomorphovibrio marinus TaxID=2164132 RepID=UPI000E0A5E0F|nr:oxygen-independent coproporphyrinogen III oxidase [Pleomorphovibrio marinus]